MVYVYDGADEQLSVENWTFTGDRLPPTVVAHSGHMWLPNLVCACVHACCVCMRACLCVCVGVSRLSGRSKPQGNGGVGHSGLCKKNIAASVLPCRV